MLSQKSALFRMWLDSWSYTVGTPYSFFLTNRPHEFLRNRLQKRHVLLLKRAVFVSLEDLLLPDANNNSEFRITQTGNFVKSI